MDDQWAGLVAEVQAQMKEAEADLPPKDYQRLKERLVLILAWVFSGRDNAHKGWNRSIAHRALAMGSALCPSIAIDGDGPSFADILGVSKQASNELRREAIGYLLTVTGATMRTIPDAEDIGDGLASRPAENENTHAESSPEHPRDCEVVDDLRAYDSAPSASGDPSA